MSRIFNFCLQAKTFAPAGNDNEALIQLCVDKLRILIEDNDQNLKYLGLLSMTRILGTSDVTFCCDLLKIQSLILKLLVSTRISFLTVWKTKTRVSDFVLWIL